MFPTLISRIFDPFIVLSGLCFLALVRDGVSGWDLVGTALGISTFLFVPLIILLWWAVKTKRVRNWDLSNRKERVRALLILFPFLLLDAVFIRYVGTPTMTSLFFYWVILFFGFYFVTLRVKISGHMIGTTTLCCFVISWFGWRWWPIVAVLPILAWSRLALKRHTVGEVIGGVLYALVIFVIAA